MELRGRDAQTRQVEQVIEGVEVGKAATIVIEAPAGLGKSSLIAFASDRVEDRGSGWRTATASVDELDTMRPTATIERALREMGRHVDGQAEIIESVEEAAAAGPVLLALDDLHRAHPGTLDVVAAIISRLADLPLLVMMAARPHPRSPELAALFDELDAAGAHWLALDPLPDHVVADWVRGCGDTRTSGGTRVSRSSARPTCTEEPGLRSRRRQRRFRQRGETSRSP